MIGWPAVHHERVSPIVEQLTHSLGKPGTENEVPSPDDEVFRQYRWTFNNELLSDVATAIDELTELLKIQEVVAQSNTVWMFAWEDEPSPINPLESAGGMLGIHLGRPHRITTMFSFRDVAKYEAIKASLSEMKLVELSDRHLRPKQGVGKSKKKKS